MAWERQTGNPRLTSGLGRKQMGPKVVLLAQLQGEKLPEAHYPRCSAHTWAGSLESPQFNA